MTDTQQQPLDPALASRVDRYLDDLGRMLATASPVDRADALGSVREYVDDSLAALERPATAADVTAILTQLGTPEDVAAGLLDGGIVGSGPAAGPRDGAGASGYGTGAGYGAPPAALSAPSTPGDQRATGALVAGIAAILLPVLGLGLGLVAIVIGRSARRAGTARESSATAAVWLGGIAVALNVLVVLGLAALLTVRTSEPSSMPGQEVVVTAP